MPLSFQSKSHGTIAFGFFNIESDMLLLENLFFFARDFSQWIAGMAGELETGEGRFEYEAWEIENREEIGDLMGAIHGIRFTGFIGEVYRQYPFPQEPSGFKQNPNGHQTREQMIAMIEKRAVLKRFAIQVGQDGTVHLGPFVFLKEDFWELIRYVWQGGYPRWKEQKPPDYVIRMKEAVQKSGHPSFNNVFL